MNKEDICDTCGGESEGGVCRGCQEVVFCCDCTRLTREEYQEWLKYRENEK
jgi:hypothetical protein